MASETKDCKISLTSSKKAISSMFLTLKVPNFLTLQEYNNVSFDIRSPTFEFADATWCFRFKNRSGEIEEWSKEFDVDIIMLNSKILHRIIFYNIAVQDSNGEEDYCNYGTIFFPKRDNRFKWCLHNFDDSAPSYKLDILTLVIHLISVLPKEEEVTTDRDAETLSQDFKKLFLNGEKHDLILRVADKEFKVHQGILMARSEVFAAALTHDMTEKQEGVIHVPDCDPQAMEQLLLYVYSGKVEALSQDNALGLYYAADKYQMVPLKEECAKFMKQSLSPAIIWDVVLLAPNHSDTDLLECATEYFVNHISQILPTAEWMSFMKSNMVAANELLIKATKKWDYMKCFCKKFKPKVSYDVQVP